MRTILLTSSCLATVLLASGAGAQSQPQPQVNAPLQDNATANAPTPGAPPSGTSVLQDTPPSAAENTGVQDIVVTAQRRSENLQRAAVAVSAVSGDALVAAGVTQPTQLTSVVPALQVQPSAGPSALFYLRGVGNFTANALSDSAIAFNFNGVYVGKPSATTGFFYDLDRVEVVKGPQGTLYGRNATGGAINVLPHQADLETLAAGLSGEYGNYNAKRLDAFVNLPIGDKAGLRLASVYVNHDGYMKDGTDDQDDLGFRGSLRVDPTSNLKVTLTGDFFRSYGRGAGSTLKELGLDNRYGLESAQASAFISGQPNLLLGRTFAPLTLQQYQRNDFWGVSSTIEWQTPAGTITIIPAHRESKLDYLTESAGFQIQDHEKDRETSVEARLASDESHPLRYLVGAFYYDENDNVPQYLINQGANFNFQSYLAQTKSMAVFGRLTYAITPSIRLNAGGRYTTEDKRFSGNLLSALRVCTRPTAYFPTYVPGCPTASPFPLTTQTVPVANFNPFIDGTITIPGTVIDSGAGAKRASFDRVTYRLGADWDVTSRNLLYASYETGFKSGGFFFSADNGIYRPETINAWTVGSKNRFLNNRVQVNLEGFYWRYKDQQISHLSTDSAGNTIFATENVGRATFKGVEAELQVRPLLNTSLSADAQYLDAIYNSFVYTTPNSNGGVSNGTGCPNAGTPGTFYTVNCSGFRPPNAPRFTLTVGVEQTIPLPSSQRLVVDVRAHYQSSSLTGQEFTANEIQGAYWIADAQVAYHAKGDRFTIGGFVNNAFNTTAVSLSYPVPLSFFSVYNLRPPRTYGIRAGAKF